MSKTHEVVLLSASKDEYSTRVENLRIKTFRSLWQLLFSKWLRWADVIHCHQMRYRQTDIAVLIGKMFGKKVFVTDLGGGERFALSYHLPILEQADSFLVLSQYSKKYIKSTLRAPRVKNIEVIYGGIDTEKFKPGREKQANTVLYVGRIVAHKGIEYLIDAIDSRMQLEIVGNVYDEEYYELLKEKSKHKRVTFHVSVTDEGLVEKYQRAVVTVQASVYETFRGDRTEVPELLGLVALESMACGTPVIVSNVASLPEIVEDEVTGFIVPPNHSKAIWEKIDFFLGNPSASYEMGQKAREHVLRLFTWDAVVHRCTSAYLMNKSHPSENLT